ncbi:putative immunity/bacteriocin fusion bifunctional protein [Pontibacillus litoralis]|uniref:Uncharacterized protein n=1 Tax=Pontibacillus litoralis JSM 072002 TaxID=1385512 RepID=A0A0A5FU67_9BACI|nr:putative immunity/bacteriocin fusion bifunctional protein [Pontibacillus litoralis]KGX84326.1 hypothetical protein N784_13670 [Pontibacillus litoralis JSM 072002]
MSTLTKRLSKSKSFTVLMLLTIVTFMFSSSFSALASTQNSEDCNCGVTDGELDENDVNYVEGQEKSEILRALETSSTFENNVNHDSISDATTKVINLGENDYADGDVLQVTSLYENSMEEIDYDLITVFVEKESKEVLKLSYFEVDSEVVDYKDFDEKGQLMLHKEFTYEDFSEGNLENSITHYSVYEQISTRIDKDSFWYKFACGFSGNVACMAGCVGSFAAGPAGSVLFTACTAACTTVWGAGLC